MLSRLLLSKENIISLKENGSQGCFPFCFTQSCIFHNPIHADTCHNQRHQLLAQIPKTFYTLMKSRKTLKRNKTYWNKGLMLWTTRLHLGSAASNISTLGILVTNLSNSLKDLERVKIQTDMEFREAKTQLERQKVDIASLRRDVRDLTKHRERVGANFSEIERKLNTTEKQLREKQARLENLETEN